MFKKIVLDNFQAHGHLDLELDPAVTTIVGSSDVGKSSIMRAFRWMACNTPSGTDFIRWGTKKCVVKIEEADGTVFSRIRSSSVNTYQVDDHEFVAFGTGVPPEIESGLGLSEVNFQGQYDSPFWLGDSAAEVSRKLNKVACLEIIDGSLARVASMVRSATSEGVVSAKRVDAAEEEVEKWKSSEVMTEEFVDISAVRSKWVQVHLDAVDLSKCAEDAAIHLKRSRVVRRVAEVGAVAVELGNDWSGVHKDIEQLGELVEALSIHDSVLCSAVPDLGTLEVDFRASMMAWEECHALLKDVEKADAAVVVEAELCNSLKDTRSEFLESIGKECPLCNNLIRS